MRTFTTLILALSTTVLAACVAQDDEPTTDATDGEQTAVVESNEIVAVPLCPDVKKKLVYPDSCWTPDGDGIRTCTDHITFHYVPVFSLPTGFPPVSSFDCKLTGTDVTTTCGPCMRIDVPPF